MYHPDDGAKVFKSEEELKAAGKGYVDSPASFKKEIASPKKAEEIIIKAKEVLEKKELPKLKKKVITKKAK